jgi:PAS domain S-box-containing protein
MTKLKAIIKSSPFIITLIYLFVGALWIAYSDQAVLSMFDNPNTITKVQSFKGWFYVLASGVLIFILIHQSNKLINDVVEDLKKNRDKFESTFEYAPVGIAHHKPNEKWINVNQTLCKLLGYTKNELLKLSFEDFIHPDDIEHGRELDLNLIEGKISSFTTEKRYRRKDGTYFTGKISKSAVYENGAGDNPQYLTAIIEDISKQIENKRKLKESLKEKEMLLSEVHHRVRNNLALMSAFLELQVMHTKNREVIEILEHYQTRLKTLSLIHEKFSENESEPFIDFNWYLHNLIDYIIQLFTKINSHVTFNTQLEVVHLNINQAIPAGLICNELLINTNYRRFDPSNNPFIDISLQTNDDKIQFKIRNNGELKDPIFNLKNKESLDSSILQSLLKQIDGELSLTDEDDVQICEFSFTKKNTKGGASHLLSTS